MIINTGMRTDIPAFYTPWFLNRLREGFVLVRNPYRPEQVTRYRLSPDVVDLIGFCTKDPAPLLPHLDALEPYGQYWFVTITPYGRDIEPGVPPVERVLESFRQLSDQVGADRVGWRYDPIFLSDKYTLDFHRRAFAKMAEALAGYTHACVISFIDLYPKVTRNFPEALPVGREDRLALGQIHDPDGPGQRHGPAALRRGQRTGSLRSRLRRVHDLGDPGKGVGRRNPGPKTAGSPESMQLPHHL